MRTIVGVLAGLIVGLSLAPAAAHHSTSTRRLERRIDALTSRLNGVEVDVNSLGYTVNSHSTSISGLSGRVTTLDSKTRHLDASGHFHGPIHMWWNNCDDSVAYWGFDGRDEYNDVMLGC